MIQMVAAWRSAASTRVRSTKPGPRFGNVDVAHGVERHADDEPQACAFGAQKRPHRHVVGHVVGRGGAAEPEHRRPPPPGRCASLP